MDDPERDLDAYMNEEPDDDLAWSEDREPVEIDGLSQADRFLGRLARLEHDEAEMKAIVNERRQRLNEYEADRMAGINGYRAWLERSLDGFMRAYNRATGNTTTNLPNGTLSLVKAGDLIRVTEAEEALVWLVEEESELDKWVKRTAEPRPGEIKKISKVGPRVDPVPEDWPEPDEGYEWHAVMLTTGQRVPGMGYLVRTEKVVKAKPAQPITYKSEENP